MSGLSLVVLLAGVALVETGTLVDEPLSFMLYIAGTALLVVSVFLKHPE